MSEVDEGREGALVKNEKVLFVVCPEMFVWFCLAVCAPYIYIYMCVCVRACACVCVCVYIYIYIYIYINIYVYECISPLP
jgi:hypothetical protein